MQNIIKNILTDVKVELSAEFDQNFTRKAFFDKKWKDRKRQGKGTLLVATGKLRRSIRAKTTNTAVVFSSSLPYAAIHNEGGEITVTNKMKRFFWAKYYELGGKIKYKNKGLFFSYLYFICMYIVAVCVGIVTELTHYLQRVFNYL